MVGSIRMCSKYLVAYSSYIDYRKALSSVPDAYKLKSHCVRIDCQVYGQ